MVKMFQWVIGSMFVGVFALSVIFCVFAAEQAITPRCISINLQRVFSAKVSLIPVKGLKTIDPLYEISDMKEGETITIQIPPQYLPGEFILKIDYRVNESDYPYPVERSIFVDKEDIQLSVNPFYGNSSDNIKFNSDEKENTVYYTFLKENDIKRGPIEVLKQFLLNYDCADSKLYAQAAKEFQDRKLAYNKWLKHQEKSYNHLYVSRLFQFQYIPTVIWSGDLDEQINQLLKNYFEGIDFKDGTIIHFSQLTRLMDSYMRLYEIKVSDARPLKTLFVEAGRIACEKAAQGDPKVYGWMVDYFYRGYETYHIDEGMVMLRQHIDNPNCLTSKKQQINKRLQGLAKLVPGALSPNFLGKDDKGNDFQFHAWKGSAPYKLLLFWSVSCESCRMLVTRLREWDFEVLNKDKVDVIAINLDETEIGGREWAEEIVNLSNWKHMRFSQGINSVIANDYAVLSTPEMFVIDSESNIIVFVPEDFEQLIKDLNEVIFAKKIE